MMATILISYASALSLGYSFWMCYSDMMRCLHELRICIHLPGGMGIDYNIIMVSRFLEERKFESVKNALEIAVRNTGGVISSAGVILAATFAALTTMPGIDLFVFGFIVAVGIIIDTFLVRGMLLPTLILFFEKDKKEA